MLTCLFAKTRRTASRSSSSANILVNSSLASLTRSLSLLSTTKIRPANRNIRKIIIIIVAHDFLTLLHYKQICICQFLHQNTLILIVFSSHTLSVLEVVPPKRPDFVLTTNIPNCETDILILYRFYIKTCMWKEEKITIKLGHYRHKFNPHTKKQSRSCEHGNVEMRRKELCATWCTRSNCEKNVKNQDSKHCQKQITDVKKKKKNMSSAVPIVGMVVTISPSLSLYRMVVLPAASRPTMRILISFFPNKPLNRFAKTFPMLYTAKLRVKHIFNLKNRLYST